MEHFDKDLKQAFKNESNHHQLSRPAKASLQELMQQELKPTRLSWWEGGIRWITQFWHTSFEINLTPVVVLASILFIALGTASWKLFIDPPQMAQDKVVYIQKNLGGTNGGTRIVFVPVRKGGI